MPSLAPRIDTLESTPTFSGQASFAAGSAAAPSLRFTVDPTTGLYRIGASNIGFTCAGVASGGIAASAWTLGSASTVGVGGYTHSIQAAPTSSTVMFLRNMTAASTIAQIQVFYNNTTSAGYWRADNVNSFFVTNAAGTLQNFAVADTGACTLGYAATNGLHTFQGSKGADFQVKIINGNVTNGSGLRVQSGTATNATSVQGWFGAGSGVGSVDGSGAWVFGLSGASGTKVSVNSSSGAMPSICNSRTMSVYNDADAFGIQAVNGFASYTGVMISAYSVRASSNLFSFISCVTGDGASGYNVANAFVVAGDGTVRAGDSGSFAITPIGEHRFYSSIAQTSFGSVDVFDTRTQTTGVGGMISFSGFKIAQTNGAIYAGIKGSKFNATSNNELGQLKFYSNDGSSLKEGGYLDPFSGWVFGLALGNTAPSLPFKPLIIQTPITTTIIGYTKFFKFGASTTVIDLVTISSASWDVGHNIDVEVQVTNIATNNYSLARGHARGIGSTSVNTITTAMVATDANNGLGLGTLAWTAGTGAATLQYTPPTNTDYSNYEITITNRKFPFTLP